MIRAIAYGGGYHLRMRKIIHVDMDAFYASVEQRDVPSLRGKPVVVAWRGARSVVCAASYEARKFGVRSAMPAVRAERLCPQAVFVPPDFSRYKAVSRQVREIFLRHTALVEPLSLDEAYLDVTDSLSALPTATAIAEEIRKQIREETGLTASAGIAPVSYTHLDVYKRQVEDSGGTASPNTSRTASSSMTSPSGVEVPCVFR